jgi:hypothetical protein
MLEHIPTIHNRKKYEPPRLLDCIDCRKNLRAGYRRQCGGDCESRRSAFLALLLRASDPQMNRAEGEERQDRVGVRVPLTDFDRTEAQRLERSGLDRDDIAERLGWSIPRVAQALRRERTCRKCDQPFMSSGIGNRLCSGCRDSNRRLSYAIPHLESIESANRPKRAPGGLS